MRRIFAALALFAIAPSGALAQEDVPAPERTAPVVAEPSPEEAEARLREQAGALAMRRGDLEGARADLARAFALAPTPERGWALADAEGALGEADALTETLRALVALAPDHPRAAEAQARLTVLESRPGRAVPEPPAAPAPAPPAEEEAEEEHDLLDEPWLWAIVAVVAGGAFVTALILTGDPGVEDPIPGDGGIVATLVEWR